MEIVKIVKKLVPSPVKNILRRGIDFITWDQWSSRSWSQEGEDLVLRRIFCEKSNGFYVDVGAHHPKRFSNTYHFYQLGWSGINIDAMPGSMNLFKKWRPRDINIEVGISKQKGVLDYYVFNEPALNGFSTYLSEQRNSRSNNCIIKEVIMVEVKPLYEILDLAIGGGRSIDFLSVDVEGFDLEVLQSNDWSKYRPSIVIAEVLNSSLASMSQDKVVQFMKDNGYTVYAKQVNSVFFKDLHIN